MERWVFGLQCGRQVSSEAGTELIKETTFVGLQTATSFVCNLSPYPWKTLET